MLRSAREVVRDTLRGLGKDDVIGEAAKIAFFLTLSFFPILLAVMSLTGIVGGAAAFEAIMSGIRGAMPPEAAAYVQQFVEEVVLEDHPQALSIGLLLLLWTGSMALFQMADSLNVMYGLQQRKSMIVRRLYAMAVLLVGTLLLLLGVAILLAGPAVTDYFGLDPVWELLQWPLAIALLLSVLSFYLYALPNRRKSVRWRGVFVGAALGALLLVLATLGIRLYIAVVGGMAAVYGALGAAIIMILWLFAAAISILAGAKLAAVIEARLGARVLENAGDSRRVEAQR